MFPKSYRRIYAKSPMLSLAHIALARGDEAICLTGAHLADSVRAAGVRFAPLPPAAGLDFRKMEEIYPEIVSMPTGPERIRFSFERAFLDPMPAQAEALRELIELENPDVVVTDSAFYGRVPLFVDTSRARPPFAALGVSFLSLTRPDGAPIGMGFPPASTDEERTEYARMGAGVDAMVTEPIRHYLDQKLVDMDVPALNLSPWDAMVLTNDVYLHPSVSEPVGRANPLSPRPCRPEGFTNRNRKRLSGEESLAFEGTVFICCKRLSPDSSGHDD